MRTAHRALFFAALAMGIAAFAPASVEAAPKTHTVGSGQSLWSIAHRYHVSVAALSHANGIKDEDSLKAGQVLTIPDAKGAKPSTRVARKPAPQPASKLEPTSKVEASPKPAPGATHADALPPLAKAAPVAEDGESASLPETPAPKLPQATEKPAAGHAAKPALLARAPHKSGPAETKTTHPATKNTRPSVASTHAKTRKAQPTTTKSRRKVSTAAAAQPKKGAPKGGDSDEGD